MPSDNLRPTTGNNRSRAGRESDRKEPSLLQFFRDQGNSTCNAPQVSFSQRTSLSKCYLLVWWFWHLTPAGRVIRHKRGRETGKRRGRRKRERQREGWEKRDQRRAGQQNRGVGEERDAQMDKKECLRLSLSLAGPGGMAMWLPQPAPSGRQYRWFIKWQCRLRDTGRTGNNCI